MLRLVDSVLRQLSICVRKQFFIFLAVFVHLSGIDTDDSFIFCVLQSMWYGAVRFTRLAVTNLVLFNRFVAFGLTSWPRAHSIKDKNR